MKQVKCLSIFAVALTLFLSLGPTSFAKSTSRIPLETTPENEQQLMQSLTEFEEQIPLILEFREKSLDLFGHLTEKLEKKDASLSARDSEQIYELSVERKKIRTFLNKIVSKYKYSVTRYELEDYQTGAQRWAFRRAYMVATALFWLDDNYLGEALFFQKFPKLRRLINESNTTYQLETNESLQRSAKLYYSFKTMMLKSKVLKVLKESERWYKEYFTKTSEMEKIQEILNASFAYNQRKNLSYGQRLKSNIAKTFEKFFTGKFGLWDFIYKLKDKIVFNISYGFGRSIAQIQWRKGKMYYDKETYAHLSSVLQPGDVLWDKTRSKISGKLISLTGFWNHNAIYMGTREQLLNLGIWDHPLIRPYQKQIEKQKVIIESLGAGVVQNTIHHFLNIDEIAIGRYKNITDVERREVILRTFTHMDKKYDFNLDVESAETIICSELVYLVYPDVNFKKEKLAGHWTVTPDLTALQTLDDGAFELITMYYEGKRIKDNFIFHMKNILETKKTTL